MSKNLMDLVRSKKKNLQAASGRREKTHKPTQGKSKFRILPNPADMNGVFWQDFGQHFIKDASGDLKAVYMCADKTHGTDCPICESISSGIGASGDDSVIEALKDSKASGRILMNALHLDGEDPSSPIILEISPTSFEKILELMEEHGNVTDLEDGVDIVITRTGKGLKTEYTIMTAAKSKPVDKSVLKNVHDLSAYVQQEWDEGLNKAISAVSSVSGLLPAPSRLALSADMPSTSPDDEFDDMAEDEDEDMYEEAPKRVAKESVKSDEPSESKPAEKSDEEMSDQELEDMLDAL